MCCVFMALDRVLEVKPIHTMRNSLRHATVLADLYYHFASPVQQHMMSQRTTLQPGDPCCNTCRNASCRKS